MSTTRVQNWLVVCTRGWKFCRAEELEMFYEASSCASHWEDIGLSQSLFRTFKGTMNSIILPWTVPKAADTHRSEPAGDWHMGNWQTLQLWQHLYVLPYHAVLSSASWHFGMTTDITQSRQLALGRLQRMNALRYTNGSVTPSGNEDGLKRDNCFPPSAIPFALFFPFKMEDEKVLSENADNGGVNFYLH